MAAPKTTAPSPTEEVEPSPTMPIDPETQAAIDEHRKFSVYDREGIDYEALAKLREPFPPNMINLLPKQIRRDDKDKFSCVAGPDARKASKDGLYCGGYHAWSVHLHYVGHAALTARLLDADPTWDWEPLRWDSNGLPLFDQNGSLWIKLTVGGLTRLGYGDAQGKAGPNAVKEAIGDALRNAGMRFGAALDLWHKGDLYEVDAEQGRVDKLEENNSAKPARATRAKAAPKTETAPPAEPPVNQVPNPPAGPIAPPADWQGWVRSIDTLEDLTAFANQANREGWWTQNVSKVMLAKKAELEASAPDPAALQDAADRVAMAFGGDAPERPVNAPVSEATPGQVQPHAGPPAVQTTPAPSAREAAEDLVRRATEGEGTPA